MIYFYDPVGLDRVVISTSYRETPFGIHKENMKGPYAGNALLVLCRNIKAFVQKKKCWIPSGSPWANTVA